MSTLARGVLPWSRARDDSHRVFTLHAFRIIARIYIAKSTSQLMGLILAHTWDSIALQFAKPAVSSTVTYSTVLVLGQAVRDLCKLKVRCVGSWLLITLYVQYYS